MATGDEVLVQGSYATVQAASSTANGAVSAGAVTDIEAALAVDVEDYPFLDFKLKISATGTPAANSEVKIYRRTSDGTDQTPAPTASYLAEPVGSFILTGAVDSAYYYHRVKNMDKNDTYYLFNKDAGTLTMALSARGVSRREV